ncbi:hypothetical protein GUITHDRAFT_163365, partial [Guillardia theta CCMP2712]
MTFPHSVSQVQMRSRQGRNLNSSKKDASTALQGTEDNNKQEGETSSMVLEDFTCSVKIIILLLQWKWAKDKHLWNLPNVLTMARVLMIPLMVAFLVSSYPGRNVVASVIFAVASLTDLVDGYLARRWKISSNFGAFLDPVADKLMVATALVFLSAGYSRVGGGVAVA